MRKIELKSERPKKREKIKIAGGREIKREGEEWTSLLLDVAAATLDRSGQGS